MNNKLDQQLQTFQGSASDDKSVYFQTPFHHLHQQNAGKTFPWFGTDQPERFNPESGYNKEDISYTFNTHGYRCKELQPAKILFLGCSYTFGTGLQEDETWAAQVANHFLSPCMNIGYQGAGIHYMQRTLMKVFDVVKPELVIALVPYSYRFELVSSDLGHPLKVWSKSGINSKTFTGKDQDRTFSYELFTTREQEDFQMVQGLFTIQQFLTAKACKFAWNVWEYEEKKSAFFRSLLTSDLQSSHWESDVFNNHIRWKDLKLKARDSSHPGKAFHETYAKEVIGKAEHLWKAVNP
jgi:hypothetical protein